MQASLLRASELEEATPGATSRDSRRSCRLRAAPADVRRPFRGARAAHASPPLLSAPFQAQIPGSCAPFLQTPLLPELCGARRGPASGCRTGMARRALGHGSAPYPYPRGAEVTGGAGGLSGGQDDARSVRPARALEPARPVENRVDTRGRGGRCRAGRARRRAVGAPGQMAQAGGIGPELRPPAGWGLDTGSLGAVRGTRHWRTGWQVCVWMCCGV